MYFIVANRIIVEVYMLGSTVLSVLGMYDSSAFCKVFFQNGCACHYLSCIMKESALCQI